MHDVNFDMIKQWIAFFNNEFCGMILNNLSEEEIQEIRNSNG